MVTYGLEKSGGLLVDVLAEAGGPSNISAVPAIRSTGSRTQFG